MMKTYTTTKKISKLTNLVILSWILIGISAILLLIKIGTKGLDSFQNIGDSFESMVMAALGISMLISSNKKINQIKGLEFSIGDSEFNYKSSSNEITFDLTNPPKSIKKTVKTIEVISQDDQVFKIDLDNFKLEYKELKQIGTSVENLRIQFEKKTTANKG